MYTNDYQKYKEKLLLKRIYREIGISVYLVDIFDRMSDRERLLEAIRCCRLDDCEHCPMQEEVCDELRVDMEELPAELIDFIERELEVIQ